MELEEVPAIRLSDLSEEQVRAYIVADNRLAELAGWDEKLLSIELKALTEIELDFDIEVTGFNTAEIDGLIIGPVEADDDADLIPKIDADAPPLTAPGDLWQLGAHRLLCGDATDPRSFEKLLDGEAAQDGLHGPALQRPYRRRVTRRMFLTSRSDDDSRVSDCCLIGADGGHPAAVGNGEYFIYYPL